MYQLILKLKNKHLFINTLTLHTKNVDIFQITMQAILERISEM